MKTNTELVLKVMNILSWITFIGLCISTGTLLYSIVFSFINPEVMIDPVNGFDVFALKKLGTTYFVNVSSLVIIISALKAYLFYLVIKIFMKINLKHPFSEIMPVLLAKISYAAFSIGLLSYIATSYCFRITKRFFEINGLKEMTDGFHEFIFFAGIIFIISLIFKRGVEIQSEQELTI
jgi:hypothetical protein